MFVVLQMSEIEDVPELITFLQRSSRSFAAIAQDQQDKLAKSMLSINVPVTFLGRYIENYKAAVSQHANAVDLLNEAHVREEAARKRVESLLEQQRALGLPAPPPVQQTPVLDDEDDDYEALSSSNLEINEFHQSHNEAQLELCRAETHCDEMKLEEQRLVGYVRKETRRLQFVERHQMLVRIHLFFFISNLQYVTDLYFLGLYGSVRERASCECRANKNDVARCFQLFGFIMRHNSPVLIVYIIVYFAHFILCNHAFTLSVVGIFSLLHFLRLGIETKIDLFCPPHFSYG